MDDYDFDLDILDELGYDLEDDADYSDEDEFEGRGYQPLTFELPPDEDDDEDSILSEFGL